MANEERNQYITYGQMNLINSLRKLFLELPMWRRAALVSYDSNIGNLEMVLNRVYSWPTDIGDILEVFFGRNIARTIENMLREQIVIYFEIVQAEKAGDSEAANQKTTGLYQSADRMAAYLSQINPYWDEETWRNLLYVYIKTTLLELVAVLAHKEQESIILYENLEDQSLDIADYMAQGISSYFIGQ